VEIIKLLLPLICVVTGFLLNYVVNEGKRGKEKTKEFNKVKNIIEYELENANRRIIHGFSPFKFSITGSEILKYRTEISMFPDNQIELITRIYGCLFIINCSIDNWFIMEIGGNKDNVRKKIEELLQDCKKNIDEYFMKHKSKKTEK